MEGVSSEMIKERMYNKKVKVLTKDIMLQWVKEEKPELLVMAGAGVLSLTDRRLRVGAPQRAAKQAMEPAE